MDGNVLRVVMRYAACGEDITLPAVRRSVQDALRRCYPTGEEAALYTEGLMELGERVCLPAGAPLCECCPVCGTCQAHALGMEEGFPRRTEKKPRTVQELTVLILSRGGQIAVRKRPPGGLLAGMWEYPNLPGHLKEKEAREAVRSLGLEPERIEALPEARHVFTHVEWRMTGYRIETDGAWEGADWLTPDEIRQHCAIPTAFRAYRRYGDGASGAFEPKTGKLIAKKPPTGRNRGEL